MRLRFKNGSFIKIDGSDNYNSHRGTRPGILVYEEYKDHRKEFREVMRPNLAVFNAPEIFIGTPPEDVDESDTDNEYVLTANEHRATHGTKTYFKKSPTHENNHISKEWLDEERDRLIRRGEEHVWLREYMAEYCKGGANKIFPMLSRDMVRPHKEVIGEIERDFKKLDFYVWADPGTATVFAVLFVAVNPYTKRIYILDEIYEQDQSEMTVRKIGDRMVMKKHEIGNTVVDWRQGYDEAALWWANEMLDHFNEGWEPSQKAQNKKDVGIGLLKDIMISDNLVISDRCKKFFWEMDNYRKDQNGKIPKKDDHLIDCIRYVLGADGYHLIEGMEPQDPEKDEMWRGSTIQNDFPELFDDEEQMYRSWNP
jgi:hypothetical protein